MLGALLGAVVAHAAWASDQSSNLIVAEAQVTGNPQLVASALVEEMTERQFVFVGQTENELRFARPVDNSDLRAKLGSLDDPLPQARVVMSLTPDGMQTAVHTQFFIVTHPGLADEQVADVQALGIDPRLQDMLDGIDGTVEAIAAREEKFQKTALAQTQSGIR
jgi:hypothetical protein